MSKECIIVGAGTYGQVFAEFLKEEYDVLGFVDDDESLIGDVINGVCVLGDFNYLLKNRRNNCSIFVPLGSNKLRKEFLILLKEQGFDTPSFIHRDAIVHESVEIGETIYILPGSIVMPYSIIGDYVIISAGVNISHHSILGRASFFAQGANVGASVYIGECAFCGIGASVMTGVKKIGNNSLIGAGTVVIRDVPDDAVVVGNPGRIIRFNS